jgi:hypothetical protein
LLTNRSPSSLCDLELFTALNDFKKAKIDEMCEYVVQLFSSPASWDLELVRVYIAIDLIQQGPRIADGFSDQICMSLIDIFVKLLNPPGAQAEGLGDLPTRHPKLDRQKRKLGSTSRSCLECVAKKPQRTLGSRQLPVQASGVALREPNIDWLGGALLPNRPWDRKKVLLATTESDAGLQHPVESRILDEFGKRKDDSLRLSTTNPKLTHTQNVGECAVLGAYRDYGGSAVTPDPVYVAVDGDVTRRCCCLSHRSDARHVCPLRVAKTLVSERAYRSTPCLSRALFYRVV